MEELWERVLGRGCRRRARRRVERDRWHADVNERFLLRIDVDNASGGEVRFAKTCAKATAAKLGGRDATRSWGSRAAGRGGA